MATKQNGEEKLHQRGGGGQPRTSVNNATEIRNVPARTHTFSIFHVQLVFAFFRYHVVRPVGSVSLPVVVNNA